MVNKEVPFIHWRTIAFGDTDAAAIVYTPRFSDYCMEAAEVWFREYIDFDWYRVNTQLGMGTPVAHMEIDFVGPLKAGDSLAVLVRVAKVGRSTVTLYFEGFRESDDTAKYSLSFTGRFVFCFTSNEAQGSVTIPDEQREYIQMYAAKCEPDESRPVATVPE